MKKRVSLLMIVTLMMMPPMQNLQAGPNEKGVEDSQKLEMVNQSKGITIATGSLVKGLSQDDVHYIYDEDFSQYAPGGFTESPECEVSADNGEFSVVENGDGTRSLRIHRDDGLTWGMTIIGKGDLKLTGIVTVDVRIKKYGKGHFSVPYIYSASDLDNPLATLAFATGYIKSHFASTQPTSLMPYEEGRWYDCRIIMYTDRNEFDIYIDGELVKENAPYRTSGFSDVDKIVFSAEKKNTGTAYIDYIRVGVGYPKELLNTKLEDLRLKQGDLQQKDEHHYIGQVTEEVKEISIVPKAEYKGATIEVDGYIVNSGATSRNIPLKRGINTIPVKVTSANKKEVEEYTITIIQSNRDENAVLKDLKINEGIITPDFKGEIFDYKMEVPYDTQFITLTPTAEVQWAAININGKPQESGKTTAPIELLVGENIINIVVNSRDGTQTNHYTINIRRREMVVDYYKVEGTIERDGGLHVSVNISSIVSEEHKGKEYVIFELFNEREPISITCMKQDIEQTSQIEMYYNMADFQSDKYTVKIYVLESYNQATLGKLLAKPVTVR